MSDENVASTPYSQTPIRLLPVELLSTIFYLDADNHRPHHYRPRVQECWMRLGHVCRVWRSVLLGLPILWARDVTCLDGGANALAPSWLVHRKAPLDLRLELLPQGTFALVYPLLSRAGLIEFGAYTHTDGEAFLNFFSTTSLPFLEILNVAFLAFHRKFKQQLIAGNTLSKAANLRHLSMKGLNLHLPVTGNLNSVSINLSHHSQRPLMDDLLRALTHNPGIKTLHLCSAFSGRSVDEFSSVLVLPALLECIFNYHGDAHLWLAFLGLVRLPIICHFKLNGNTRSSKAENVTQNLTLPDAAWCACAGAPALSHDVLVIKHCGTELSVYFGPSGAHANAGIRLGILSDEQQEARVGAVVRYLTNEGILGRIRKLQLIVSDIETDVIQRWETLVLLCAETQKLYLQLLDKRAVAVIGLVADARVANASLPLLVRIAVTFEKKGRKNNDISSMLDAPEGTGVMLEVNDGGKIYRWMNESRRVTAHKPAGSLQRSARLAPSLQDASPLKISQPTGASTLRDGPCGRSGRGTVANDIKLKSKSKS